MAAILGLEDSAIQAVCDDLSEAGGLVSCANFNSPGQVVIAGHSAAVERACDAARAAGARRAVVLPVSVPSHCGLMKSAAEGLEAALAEISIHPPAAPVLQNVDARSHDDPADIRAALVAQVWQPVLWTSTVQSMITMGITRLAECGPGKVLTGLVRRISKDISCVALTDGEVVSNAIADWSTT